MKRLIAMTLATYSAILPLVSQNSVRIWKNTEVEAKTVVTSYLPQMGHPCAAVVVCPGGSYFWLDRESEGRKVGEWLRDNGIAAFVLEYRTGGIFEFVSHSRLFRRGNRFPDPMCDLQRTFQLIREHADSLGIDSGRVGVMGFSAGGHLAVLSGELSETDFLKPLGIATTVSLRPDFIAAIYPVVTFTDSRFMHRRSRRGLLADRPSKALCDSLSLERHVPAGMPPVFLMNCKDDPIVRYQNSELLDSALTEAGVDHRYIQVGRGGHGFGADVSKNSEESAVWMPEFLRWLDAQQQ